MSREFTYSNAGVNRELRAKSKRSLSILEKTYSFSFYGKVVHLPYGKIFPLGKERYLDMVIEGVGTKVLIAQLAEKYDTIGIDGVAMAVNDVIRSGAKPLAIVDNIHAQVSDPNLVKDWLYGVVKGAIEARCVIPNGEIGDVADLIKGLTEGKGFDMVFAALGEVKKANIISGRGIRPGDVVIGLGSSGIHSNGISLARKSLFREWGGKYYAHAILDELDRELILEVLEPTKIYVKPVLEVAKQLDVKAAVHITGDAYLKFGHLTKFSKGVGFIFDNFKPQPIFELIRRTASELGKLISIDEMFKTFNMGWGFALILEKKDENVALDILEKTGTMAETIGHITDQPHIGVLYKHKKIILK
ncbi:MAG: phosphoribosylformylglycinamidine cyclo-ligase [Candidatus Bathyarchaeota archaeon]|jgi:phosphoribosylformylglycinamidine cyclo-ligase